MDKVWTLNFRLASRIDASVIFESNESLAMIVHNFCADKITTDDDEYDDFLHQALIGMYSYFVIKAIMIQRRCEHNEWVIHYYCKWVSWLWSLGTPLVITCDFICEICIFLYSSRNHLLSRANKLLKKDK